MRIIRCVSLLLIISSCTQQTPSEAIEEKTNEPVSSQASTNEKNGADDNVPAADEEPAFYGDSTFYIGFVNYFPETKEFYTTLYYRKDKVDESGALEKLLDSTVYKDDEVTRRRLPLTAADDWFVTEDIHKLFVYNNRHELVTTASLVRIEKLDDMIESQFIAVYKPETFLVQDNETYYGITEETHGYEIKPVSIQQVEDPKLDQTIIQDLKINSQGLRMRHYKLVQANSIYSVISSDTESYITELKESNLRVLAERHDDTFFTGILPLTIHAGERPLLLVDEAVQDSDIAWSYLAVFQDSAYVPVSRGRMPIRYKKK